MDNTQNNFTNTNPQPAVQSTIQPVTFLPPTDKVETKKDSKSFNVIVVVMILIVLVLVGFIVYALTQLNKTPNTETKQTNNENTQATTPEYFTNFIKVNNAIADPSNTTSTAGRIALGLTGSGDSKGTSHPTVLKIGSKYKMWYTGDDDSGIARIYYAESDDLLTWTKYDNSVPSNSDTTSTNGRLGVGTTGKADSKSLANPSVLYKDGQYKMWYCGYDGINRRTLYATSPDGLTWTKYDNSIASVSDTTGTNGRIPLGSSGRLDEKDACSPEVIWEEEDQTYKMWYSSVDPGYIGMATSKDGLTWTKIDNKIPERTNTSSTNGRIANGLKGSRDYKYVRNPSVIKLNGTYHMWYVVAPETGAQSLGYATSKDGLNWTKYDNTLNSTEIFSNGLGENGYLYRGTEGTIDAKGLGAADMLFENGKLYMFMFGTDFAKIQTAVSTDLKY